MADHRDEYGKPVVLLHAGAPPHFLWFMWNNLNETYSDQWIGRRRPLNGLLVNRA